jgi:hypothetical protein
MKTMKKTPAMIIAATAFVAAEAFPANAKDARMEIRRAIAVNEVRQGRGTDDAVTATPDVRQGRGADDAVAATPDVRQGRGADDAVTATPDVRQGRGADDALTATPDVRQGRGADDAVTATPDVRQGRGTDDAVTTVVTEDRGIVSTFVNFVTSALGFGGSAPAATADAPQGQGTDDAVVNADGTPHIRQSRGADDAVVNADGTPHIRQSRGTDDAAVNADGTPHIRQSRGADDAVVNADGTPHIRQSRGTDDAAVNADGTPHIRQSRGADDAAVNADGTPHIRQSRGADDAVVNADGTPHIRQSRGADEVVTTASGALVPTSADLSANSQNTTELRAYENQVVFGTSQQASQTAGLAPQAIYRTNGKRYILDVIVAGYGWQEGMGTADLENGEIIGNLPSKQRLRFSVYANAQQALAAASIWATPGPQATRADSDLIAAETGIITWDAETGRPDDDGSDGMGSINGLFLTSERMPELSVADLRGKVIQIYGPLVTSFDYAGNPISYARQVYWTSTPLR